MFAKAFNCVNEFLESDEFSVSRFWPWSLVYYWKNKLLWCAQIWYFLFLKWYNDQELILFPPFLKNLIIYFVVQGVLSAVVLSLIPIIRPFEWQSLFLPVSFVSYCFSLVIHYWWWKFYQINSRDFEIYDLRICENVEGLIFLHMPFSWPK